MEGQAMKEISVRMSEAEVRYFYLRACFFFSSGTIDTSVK